MQKNTELTMRVPGKMILAGEYSVLAGKPALAYATRNYLTVKVLEAKHKRTSSKTKENWQIQSCLWDQTLNVSAMDLMTGNYPDACAMVCQTLVEAIRINPEIGPRHLRIECEWPINWGLGSSSALRLALLATLGVREPLETAQALQRQQQGISSGCDAYVQYHGGVWSYRMHGRSVRASSKRLKKGFAQNGLFFFTHPPQQLKNTAGCIQGVLTENTDTKDLHAASDAFYQVMHAAFCEDPSDRPVENQLSVNVWKNLLHKCTDLRRTFIGSAGYTPEMEQLARLPGLGRTWEFKGLGAWGPETLMVLCQNPEQLSRIRMYLENIGCKKIDFEIDEHGLTETQSAHAQTREVRRA